MAVTARQGVMATEGRQLVPLDEDHHTLKIHHTDASVNRKLSHAGMNEVTGETLDMTLRIPSTMGMVKFVIQILTGVAVLKMIMITVNMGVSPILSHCGGIELVIATSVVSLMCLMNVFRYAKLLTRMRKI